MSIKQSRFATQEDIANLHSQITDGALEALAANAVTAVRRRQPPQLVAECKSAQSTSTGRRTSPDIPARITRGGYPSWGCGFSGQRRQDQAKPGSKIAIVD